MSRRWLLAALAAVMVIVLLVVAPRAALAGWRAAFLVMEAVPAGAIVLLLIARLTGANWLPALMPLLRPLPLLLLAFVPVVLDQALERAVPDHLRLWLSTPFFAARGLAMIVLWWWLAWQLARERLSMLGAGLGLLAHGVALTVIATDWILGAAPAQPESAVAMVLTTIQIAAAAATVQLFWLGEPFQRADLAKLGLAACLGLAYLLFVDFLIVWFGDLPARVGWYVDRQPLPWSVLPGVALVLGLPPAIIGASLPASIWGPVSGGCILLALAGAALWLVEPGAGWLAIPAAAAGLALWPFAWHRRARA